MKIETSDSVRERFAAALGFDEPSALDLVNRSDFADEESYLDACIRAEMERSNPEYRAIRNRLRSQLRKREEAEAQERQAAAYSNIRAAVSLEGFEQKTVDEQAAALARADLAAGKITASELGATIEKYARDLGEKKRDEKAAASLFNAMLRGEL